MYPPEFLAYLDACARSVERGPDGICRRASHLGLGRAARTSVHPQPTDAPVDGTGKRMQVGDVR